jgi:hypothetical protein
MGIVDVTLEETDGKAKQLDCLGKATGMETDG